MGDAARLRHILMVGLYFSPKDRSEVACITGAHTRASWKLWTQGDSNPNQSPLVPFPGSSLLTGDYVTGIVPNLRLSLQAVKPFVFVSGLSLNCFRSFPEPYLVLVSPKTWPFSLPEAARLVRHTSQVVIL